MPLFGGPPNVDKLKAKHDIKGLIKALGYESDKAFDPVVHRVRRAAQEALKDLAPDSFEPLVAALSDAETPGRGAAGEVLASIGDSRAFEPLVTVYSHEKNPVLRRTVEQALKKLGAQHPETLIAAINHREEDVRLLAISTLGEIKETRAVQPLIALLEARAAEHRASELLYNGALFQMAAKALGEIGDKGAVPSLIAALRDPNPEVRLEAIGALGKLGSKRAVEPLIAALWDSDYRVCGAAARILGGFRDERAIEPLIQALKGKKIRDEATGALERIGPASLGPLLTALNDFDSETRQSVAPVLAALGWITREGRAAAQQAITRGDWGAAIEVGASAVAPLTAALETRDPTQRRCAAGALGQIGARLGAAQIDVAGPAVGKVVDRLMDVASHDGQSDVRQAAVWALGQIGDTRAVGTLVKRLHEKTETDSVRRDARAALVSMAKADPQAFFSALRRAPFVGWGANTDWLMEVGSTDALVEILAYGPPDDQSRLVHIFDMLAGQGAPAAEALVRLMNESRFEQVRLRARDTLARMGAPAVAPLIDVLRRPGKETRRRAAELLVSYYRSGALDEQARQLVADQRDLITAPHQDNQWHNDVPNCFSESGPHTDQGIGIDFPL